MLTRTLFAASFITGALALGGCLAEADDDEVVSADADLTAKADEEWFYSGELPALESPNVVVSLAGHTARVTGYVPAGVRLGDLPHVKLTEENGRRRADIVYPIATAAPGKSNSRPGTYSFYGAQPYRPDGKAWTKAEGEHFVPWGGFPFIGYNDGIAFHGPITSQGNRGSGSIDVWYLRRGTVSGGCNRMMGEHVVELAHVLGINMRKLYTANGYITPKTTAKVNVIEDFDTYQGKYIDVDYPTDTGAKRPGKVYGAENVVMFGSWVASEMPNGKDLPPNMQWEGGVSGRWYVFAEHARRALVCSMPKAMLPELKAAAARRPNAELPGDFCTKKMDCDERLGRTCTVAEIGL